jgi:AraC family transcriptional regulator
MERYQDRVERVRVHIRENLSGDLSLDALSDVAAMSRFHWHRVFAAMTGETLAEAVRRARLNRAAVLVVTTAEPVAVVARRCGFDNLQVFNRNFRAAFGMTPAALRNSGARQPPRLTGPIQPFSRGERPMSDFTIRDEPAFEVAAIPHHGDYTKIGAAFSRHWDLVMQHGLADRMRAGIGLYYDDPAVVPEAELRSHAGCEVIPGTPLPEVFDRVAFPAGRVAVLTYKGPYDGIPAAWRELYGHWLPGSGAEAADRVPYERYLNAMHDTAPADLLTEIVVPLKGA